MKTLREFVESGELLVVAHRGASLNAPENTISAFDRALAHGVHMIELDVQFSSDKHPIVFHDETLGRTTEGERQIGEMPLTEIQDLDVGSWFGESFKGERIPTLREILQHVRGKAFVMIELKPPAAEDNWRERVDIIVEEIQRVGMDQFVLCGSFHHASISYLREQYPEIGAAAINIPGSGALPSQLIAQTGAHAVVLAIEELTDDVVADIQQNNILCGAYSADSIEQLNFVLGLGLNIVVTNTPSTIMPLLQA